MVNASPVLISVCNSSSLVLNSSTLFCNLCNFLGLNFFFKWSYQKKKLYKACNVSLKYVDKAILTAPGYGKGFGPLNHLVLFNPRNINV